MDAPPPLTVPVAEFVSVFVETMHDAPPCPAVVSEQTHPNVVIAV